MRGKMCRLPRLGSDLASALEGCIVGIARITMYERDLFITTDQPRELVIIQLRDRPAGRPASWLIGSGENSCYGLFRPPKDLPIISILKFLATNARV